GSRDRRDRDRGELHRLGISGHDLDFWNFILHGVFRRRVVRGGAGCADVLSLRRHVSWLRATRCSELVQFGNARTPSPAKSTAGRAPAIEGLEQGYCWKSGGVIRIRPSTAGSGSLVVLFAVEIVASL